MNLWKTPVSVLLVVGIAALLPQVQAQELGQSAYKRKALITGIENVPIHPCEQPQRADVFDVLDVNINKTRFKANYPWFENQYRFLDVPWSFGHPLQAGDYYSINETHRVIGVDVCRDTIPDTPFPFLISFVDLQTDAKHAGAHPDGPHAFIYVPMRLAGATGERANEFYLLMFATPAEDDPCDGNGMEAKRCNTLRTLQSLHAEAPGGEAFKRAAALGIRDILTRGADRNPDAQSLAGTKALRMKGHNGVIHGSLK